MKERLLLWSDVIVPLRLVCAEKGFALDVQDDLWARNTLTEHAIRVLAAQDEAAGDFLAGYIENQIDVVLVRVESKERLFSEALAVLAFEKNNRLK